MQQETWKSASVRYSNTQYASTWITRRAYIYLLLVPDMKDLFDDVIITSVSASSRIRRKLNHVRELTARSLYGTSPEPYTSYATEMGNFVQMPVFSYAIFPLISRTDINFRPHGLNVKVPSLWTTAINLTKYQSEVTHQLWFLPFAALL